MNNQQNSNGENVPFFARYLEGQIYQEMSTQETENVKGGFSGGQVVTLAYPSDNEDVGGGQVVTMAYPSDNEDVGGDNWWSNLLG